MDLQSQIQKEIPKKPCILGTYDDEEERWIKAPKEEILKMVSMEMNEITQFVRDTIREIKRMSNAFPVDRVSFDLNIKGNGVKFSVVLKREEKIV